MEKKYSRMVQINKVANRRKVDKAIYEIDRLSKVDEKVTVAILSVQTGFSRGFFYQNRCVRERLNKVFQKQGEKGLISKRVELKIGKLEAEKIILNEQYEEVKKENEKLKRENDELRRMRQKARFCVVVQSQKFRLNLL